MTKIYLSKNNDKHHHDAILSSEGPQPDISIYVDLKPTYFEVRMSFIETLTIDGEPTTTKTKYLVWHKISNDILAKKPGISDQTLWAPRDQSPISADQLGLWEVQETDLVDVFSETFISKPEALLQYSSPHYKSSYSFFMPYVSDDMTTYTYRLHLDQKFNYVIDPTSPSKDLLEEGVVTSNDLLAEIVLTGPSTIAPNSVATINVSTLDGISDVYLEQVHGGLPKVKVPLTSGVGSFKVKVGYRKWTNRAKYTKTIS
jgi:hypothetical protein